MTLDEFRTELDSYLQVVIAEGDSLKDPYVALERLSARYKGLDADDRFIADTILGEWVLSNSERIRSLAEILIDDLKVRTAVPALQELAGRLASSGDVSAPYELKIVSRILVELSQ
jgi:hypothetical protein